MAKIQRRMVTAAERTIEPILQDMLRGWDFGTANLRLLRYVPIVMPPELLNRYPARSEALLKQRILDCAPQLDYETFVRGSFTGQLRTYVDGIRTAALLLPKFGFSSEEIRAFEALLSEAFDRAIRA